MRQNIVKTKVIEDVYDEKGNVIDTLESEFETLHIFADKGKVFREKESGEILTDHISLGDLDSVENYEEISI